MSGLESEFRKSSSEALARGLGFGYIPGGVGSSSSSGVGSSGVGGSGNSGSGGGSGSGAGILGSIQGLLGGDGNMKTEFGGELGQAPTSIPGGSMGGISQGDKVGAGAGAGGVGSGALANISGLAVGDIPGAATGSNHNPLGGSGGGGGGKSPTKEESQRQEPSANAGTGAGASVKVGGQRGDDGRGAMIRVMRERGPSSMSVCLSPSHYVYVHVHVDRHFDLGLFSILLCVRLTHALL